MSNQAYVNSQSSTGTCTIVAPIAPGVVWNLTSLQISQAGPSISANPKLTIYDGAVGGNVIYAAWLGSPVAAGAPTGGSVGFVQDIPLPRDPQGRNGLQASPGNQMTIQVVGTGQNAVSINARFSDGVP